MKNEHTSNRTRREEFFFFSFSFYGKFKKAFKLHTLLTIHIKNTVNKFCEKLLTQILL